LQIVVAPHRPLAVAQVFPALIAAEERIVAVSDDSHLDPPWVGQAASGGARRHEGADVLSIVGVNEDAMLHRPLGLRSHVPGGSRDVM
jgi:hypothetical protein